MNDEIEVDVDFCFYCGQVVLNSDLEFVDEEPIHRFCLPDFEGKR